MTSQNGIGGGMTFKIKMRVNILGIKMDIPNHSKIITIGYMR